jgi:hypothetical protein
VRIIIAIALFVTACSSTPVYHGPDAGAATTPCTDCGWVVCNGEPANLCTCMATDANVYSEYECNAALRDGGP